MAYFRSFCIVARAGLVLLVIVLVAVRRAIGVAVAASAVSAIAFVAPYQARTRFVGTAPVFFVAAKYVLFLVIHDAAAASVCNCLTHAAERNIPSSLSHM